MDFSFEKNVYERTQMFEIHVIDFEFEDRKMGVVIFPLSVENVQFIIPYYPTRKTE